MPDPTEPRAGSRAGHSDDERRAGESTTEKLRREADEAAAAVRDETSKLGEDLRAGAHAEAESLKEQAGEQVTKQRFDAADHIDAVAEALRAGVDALESNGHGAMADYWRSAADGAGRLAERIRHKPLAEAWRSTEDSVREEPALSFGGAMVAGFMIARFLKSSEPDAGGHRASGERGHGSARPADTELGSSWPGGMGREQALRPTGSPGTEAGSSRPVETAREPASTPAGAAATARPHA
jgi:ElaB/YqjD/DUF883 family membrane-anchored ribosome-binding protein